jgi:NADH-quinone oxidoreductase subunit J
MPSFLFYLLSALMIVSSLVMVTRRHPLPAAISLVVAFLSLAGLYAMLSAPLLAILQVLVYAGAIMALVVFVIMLLNVRDEDLPPEPNMYVNVGVALAVVAPFFAILVGAIRKLPVSDVGPALPAGFGGIKAVGLHLFNNFAFPFELVSLLLTVAVVGVVVLAKRRI